MRPSSLPRESSTRRAGRPSTLKRAMRALVAGSSSWVTSRSAAGRLVLNVLASVSAWEREATGERTRDALAHLRSEGVALGGEALGWSRIDETDAEGRRVVVDVADERETVARMVALRAEGKSLRAIAAALLTEGRRTKRAGRWAPETVRKALARVGDGAVLVVSR